jgi:GNAT superfamily N-acetyltransferase
MRRALEGPFELDDDRERIDVDVVHRFLSEDSYWAAARPRETTERLVRESRRVIGLYDDDELIGFARVVSDDEVIAWLADVFVLPEYRGRGLGVELVREAVENGPQRDCHWYLHTLDAHGLYERFGFGPPMSTRTMFRPRKGFDAGAPWVTPSG